MFLFKQEPRPLLESDLEKVLTTSKKTKVAAGEYSRLSSMRADSDSAINEISKLVASHILNVQSDN